MIPDFDTQLAAVIKALDDTIRPAMDAENQVATEQLQLAIATLGIVRDRLPLLHRYLRRDLEDNLALARELLPLVAADGELHDNLRSATRLAEAMLADPANGPAELQDQARHLRETIAALPGAVTDPDTQAAIDRAVVRAAKRMLDRGRAWTVAMGFEPDPAAVPDLDDLL